jgi:hypothetical protein
MTRQRPESKRAFRVASCVAAAALAAALGNVLVGCDDEFEGCEASRTCPVTDAATDTEDGGDGMDSDAGEVGSDVAPDAQACTTDAECMDADACNGTETCEQGFCETGLPTQCENPDPSHCAVECLTELADGGLLATCSVTALDADSDEHGDALCLQAVPLGDDCDDANQEIHPARAEICNGIDDDCDAKIDIADDVPLGGTPVPIVTSTGGPVVRVDATWSDAASSFGVVWVDVRDGSFEIYFARVDGEGNKIGSDVPVSAISSTLSDDPAIAPGPDGFGVVWVEGEAIYFRAMDGSGNPVFAPKLVATLTGTSPGEPDLVHDGTQGWIITFSSNVSTSSTDRVVWGARVSDAGNVVQTPISVSIATGALGRPSIARVGDVVLSQWQDGTQTDRSEIRGAYRGLLLEDRLRTTISDATESATVPVLAADGLFFSAWWNELERVGIHVAIEDPQSQARVCDKPRVAPTTVGAPEVVPFSAAFDGTDFVVIHAAGDGTDARLTVISKSCEVVRGPAPLSPFVPIVLQEMASVAAGGGRVAVFWIEPQSTGGPSRTIMAQAFSAQSYCE